MPNYKMVDADILDGAMLETAKAIREKGGTEELIAWNKSTGYKEAIEAIKGGGGLNFEVVGGTVQPTNPVENMIWVNTDQEIAGWTFSEDEPANPTDGMVWIFISASGAVEFNALKENAIQVRPILAKQYADGEWGSVPAEIYHDGAWVSLSRVIYLYGDVIEPLLNNVGDKSGWTNVAATFNDDHILLKSTNSGTYSCSVITEKKISFASCKKICILLDFTYTEWGTLFYGISSVNTTNHRPDATVTEINGFNTDGTQQILELEIPSDVTDGYLYIGIARISQAKIYKWWLE